MVFDVQVFERLLFPIHKSVYEELEMAIRKVDQDHPGQIDWIKETFDKYHDHELNNVVQQPDSPQGKLYPSLNVTVMYRPDRNYKMSELKKVPEPIIGIDYNENNGTRHPGNHFLLGYHQNRIEHSFIVPLEYILGVRRDQILKPESHQLYAHSIIPKETVDEFKRQANVVMSAAGPNEAVRATAEPYKAAMYQYIGITKRSWQKRLREHLYASQRGSHLRFHKALRGEIVEAGIFEHIVEKAGLSESAALDHEEREVEKGTLYPAFNRGLNMIPGGRSGLRFISHWAKRTGYKLKDRVTADNVESLLEDLQNHSLKKVQKSGRGKKTNEKLAQRWAQDMNYRILAITNRGDRLSLEEILLIRRLHASGWSVEKTLKLINKDREILVSSEQIEKLMKGITYSSIPDVIL